MRLTVSLPDSEAEFLQKYQQENSIASRSAVVTRALQLLREANLVDQYRLADIEWRESGEAEAWEPTVADGIENPDEAW